MDTKLVELYVKRGHLRERVGAQRAQFTIELAPLSNALRTVDRARALLHQAGLWMAANPGVVAVAGVAMVIWKPRTLLRSARFGFGVWRNWSRWRDWLRVGLSVL